MVRVDWVDFRKGGPALVAVGLLRVCTP
jgi:hypothetical protein